MDGSTSISLQKQVEELLKEAEKRGVTNNFFFITTFKRYQTQMKILQSLEQKIEEFGPIVEKEYIKGKPNLMANPAVTEYNKTASAANRTVATLVMIIESLTGVDTSSTKAFSRLDEEDDEDDS